MTKILYYFLVPYPPDDRALWTGGHHLLLLLAIQHLDTDVSARGLTSDNGDTDHAPGQATVQDIIQGVNGGLVSRKREEGLEGARVGGGDQETVEDPEGKHDPVGVSTARVPMPSVALT